MKEQKASHKVSLRPPFSPLTTVSNVQDTQRDILDEIYRLSNSYSTLLKSLVSVQIFNGSIPTFNQLETKAKQQIIFHQEEKALKQAALDQSQLTTKNQCQVNGGGVHGVVYKNDKHGYWLDGGEDELPVVNVPFGELITNGLLKDPASIILKDIVATEEISSYDFLTKMNCISNFLNTWQGIKRGETILFYVNNSIDTMLFFTACFKSGVVAANAGFSSIPDHPKTLVEMCGASIIFTESSLLDQVRNVKSLLDQPLKIIVKDGQHQDCTNLQDILNDNNKNNKNNNNNNINSKSVVSDECFSNVSNRLSNGYNSHQTNHKPNDKINNNHNNNIYNNNMHNTMFNTTQTNGNTIDKHAIHNTNASNDEINIHSSCNNQNNNNINDDSNDVSQYINVDDTALIIFSSGTTGLAKAIQLSHRNLNYQLAVSLGKNVRKIQPGQIVFAPFNHLSGSIIPLFGIATSCPTHLFTKFNVDQYLQLLKENKLQSVFTVPRILNQIAKNADFKKFNPQFSNIKEFICGTAPLAPEIATQICKKMPGVSLRGSYGLTEISGMCSVMPGSSNENGTKSPNNIHMSGCSESVGIPLPSVKIKIIDLITHLPLGPHQNGEVLLKSPMIMKGYLDERVGFNPVSPVDQDGWLHTGDFAYFDDNGYLYIVDRIKDIISCSGHQVSPLELESLLMRHDDVMDAGVFSVAGPGSESLAAAWVVLREGAVVSETELIELVAAHAPANKRLEGGLDFVDKIPRSASGKIIRWEMERKVD